MFVLLLTSNIKYYRIIESFYLFSIKYKFPDISMFYWDGGFIEFWAGVNERHSVIHFTCESL